MHLDATKLVALYGALVSTFAVAWNVYRDSHDRARLKLSAKLGYIVNGGERVYFVARTLMLQRDPDIVKGAGPGFFLTITNTGRRPVLVEGWAIRTNSKKTGHENFVYKPTILPKILKEGEYAVERTNDLSLLAGSTRQIYAWDTTGKDWSLPRCQLRELQREAQTWMKQQIEQKAR